jgi:hypothetical protein
MREHNRFFGAAAALVLALTSTGCFRATFEDPSMVKGEEHEEWRSRFLAGTVSPVEVDTKHFCPDGRVAEIRTGGNLATSALTIGTLFIYTPRKIIVTCAAANSNAAGGAL